MHCVLATAIIKLTEMCSHGIHHSVQISLARDTSPTISQISLMRLSQTSVMCLIMAGLSPHQISAPWILVIVSYGELNSYKEVLKFNAYNYIELLLHLKINRY